MGDHTYVCGICGKHSKTMLASILHAKAHKPKPPKKPKK